MNRSQFLMLLGALGLYAGPALAADSTAVARPDSVRRTLREIEVVSPRAYERKSAVAFTELDRQQVREKYQAQDVPMLLAETPGVYAYSDAGNGIGYSYVQVRGFPQRRVAVTINGIPENDPESHEVYWVDHPDILASATSVQIQRGVGAALYGASAVGGSVNLETTGFPAERRVSAFAGFGSYNTRRFSLDYESGLLDDKYAVSGRYSRILSDGYRDQSWTRLWSYYFSVARLDSWLTSRVNIYGGPENLHLAYYGVDRSYLDGTATGNADKDRRYNPLEWKGETDNFFEPRYELIQDAKLSERATLTSSLFFFNGDGYYDDFPYGPQDLALHHLGSFNVDSDSLYPTLYYQLDSTGAPARLSNGKYRVVQSELTQRLSVTDKHYGWIPRARIHHDHGELTVGAEWREHTGRHFGEITWAQALAPGSAPNTRFYDYTGHVRVLSAYAEEAWEPAAEVRVNGSLQLRHTRYAVDRDVFNGYDFSLGYTFLNPRLGANWNVDEHWNVFGSFAHVQVEPILGEIYRADDPTATPLFGTLDVANHMYRDPLVHPEKLNDFEAGAGLRSGSSYLKATAYWLDFRDEIVPNGGITSLGTIITSNAARSAHRGLELEGAWRHGSGVEISGNASFSSNRFKEFMEHVTPGSTVDHADNSIAGFPAFLGNFSVGYRRGLSHASVGVTASGTQYLDNTEDNRTDPSARAASGYQALQIESHATLNAALSLDLGEFGGARHVTLDLRGNNLADRKYETAGYVFDGVPYFIPAAGRNVFAGLRADF